MSTLFSVEPAFPEGFSYTPGFISEDEEQALLAKISNIELHNFTFQGYTANRKVASFGYDYSFDNGSLTKGKDIPEAFNSLIEKVSNQIAVPKHEFAELLIIQYPVGSVINWHRDAPPFDIIVGISLMADCVFRLRPHEKARQTRSSVISFPVARRSLYIMKGPSRTDWQHSTSPVKDVRYSITLRTLRAK